MEFQLFQMEFSFFKLNSNFFKMNDKWCSGFPVHELMALHNRQIPFLPSVWIRTAYSGTCQTRERHTRSHYRDELGEESRERLKQSQSGSGRQEAKVKRKKELKKELGRAISQRTLYNISQEIGFL